MPATTIGARTVIHSDWPADCPDFPERLRDMVMAASVGGTGDDLVDFVSATGGGVRILHLRPAQSGPWMAVVTSHQVLNPDTDWAFTGSPADQALEFDDLYRQLVTWLGPGSLLLASPTQSAPGSLVVRVDRASRWFMRFPLSAFHQTRTGFLKNYSGVDWIVTEKTFLRHYEERERLRRDLSDLALFLSGSVIVINTYREFAQFAECAEGTRALLAVLKLLRDVQLGNSSLSLRWYLNPSAETVRVLLRDQSTRYFFANFEAATGEWETGEGDQTCWDLLRSSEGRAATRQILCIELAADSLSHVRLMRVFHCFSAFDPYLPDRDPADEGTIVSRLLRAGAGRVEGGMTKETFLDFITSVASMFVDNPAFAFVLQCKALESDVDWVALRSDLSRALELNQTSFQETS